MYKTNKPKNYINPFCHKCGSPNTDVKRNGRTHWYQWQTIDDLIHFLVCGPCYRKYIFWPKQSAKYKAAGNTRKNPREKQRIATAKHRAEKGRTREEENSLCYKGKWYYYPFAIRCGVCTWCRAVKGIDTEWTSLHHDENRYDDSNPLRYTIELCMECHGTVTIQLQMEDGSWPKHLEQMLMVKH